MKTERWKDSNGREHRKVTITVQDIRKRFGLPDDATVTFKVPGGADWSGLDVELGVDTDNPIVAVWDRF